MHEFTQEIDKVSSKKHNEYMKFFETIRDLLVQNFMEKKADLKERLEQINKYSNNSIVRNLSTEEKLYLYEAKRVFDIHYVNTNPAHSIFLDTKFKIKYICDEELSLQEKRIVEDYLYRLLQAIIQIKKVEMTKNIVITYIWIQEKKARKLIDTYTDDKLEKFKIELKELSDLYWK